MFVFAITQVTAFMAEDLGWRSALRGLVLLSLLWWAWCSYAWLGNQAHADEGVVRVAVEGETFRDAFPQVSWLVGGADLSRWRGQLDYWVFVDGQLGQVAGSVNGEAGGIEPGALQATIEVLMTATDRGADLAIYPPGP